MGVAEVNEDKDSDNPKGVGDTRKGVTRLLRTSALSALPSWVTHFCHCWPGLAVPLGSPCRGGSRGCPPRRCPLSPPAAWLLQWCPKLMASITSLALSGLRCRAAVRNGNTWVVSSPPLGLAFILASSSFWSGIFPLRRQEPAKRFPRMTSTVSGTRLLPGQGAPTTTVPTRDKAQPRGLLHAPGAAFPWRN